MSNNDAALINPAAFSPSSADINVGPVIELRGWAKQFGTGLSARFDAVGAHWAELGTAYRSPTAGRVLALVESPVQCANEVGDSSVRVALVLARFAGELLGLKSRLAAFEARAEEFRARALRAVDAKSYDQAGWRGWTAGASAFQCAGF